MAAIEIVEAFEEEYKMSFEHNQDRARDFTNGWCAAMAAAADSKVVQCSRCGCGNVFPPRIEYRCTHCGHVW